MRFKLSVLIVFLLFFSCKKKSNYAVEVIGHAGNGLEIQSSIYHSNSLEAIELALGTVGISSVEVDVQFSKDTTIWLLHDDLLDTETSGNGCVANSTESDLQKVHFKTVNKEKLAQFKHLNFSQYAGKTFYLDLRHYNGCSYELLQFETYKIAFEGIINQWPLVNFIFVSNDQNWISAIGNSGWNVYAQIESMEEYQQFKQNGLSFNGIVIRTSAIDHDQVKLLQSENKKVILFDIRAPKTIRQALEKQPDGIMVDDIKAALIEKSN